MRGKAAAIRGLYTIIDAGYAAPSDFKRMAIEMTGAGARIVQLRAKGLAFDELAASCREVRDVTSRCGALFIVNDSVEAARASGADGVHIGQGDTSVGEARKILGAGAIIGVSTHNAQEAARAAEEGADYISFGPVFPTRTKKDADAPKGLESLEVLAASARLPVVAIGGITEKTAGDALRSGASAVAIISDILLAGDLRAKVASIISALML